MAAHVYTPASFKAMLDAHVEAVPAMQQETAEDVAKGIHLLAIGHAPGTVKDAVTTSAGDKEATVGVSRALAGNAAFVLTGTGIYGALHREIRTRKRGMPVGHGLFRKVQRGTRPNAFFQDAVRESQTSVLPAGARDLGEKIADLERKTP